VRGTVSTTPEAENRQLQVYPNPSAGKCLLTVNNDKTGAITIEVFNMIGNQVLSLRDVKNATDFEKELDLSHLSKGVYIVAFTLNKQTIWKKIVKL
jgi:hypothetical protein